MLEEPNFGDYDEVATKILTDAWKLKSAVGSLEEIPSPAISDVPSNISHGEMNTMSDMHTVEKIMTYLPQAQGMNAAEILALAKREGGGFGEGGQGMFFLLFLLLLLGRNGSGLFGGADSAAAVSQLTQNGITRADLQVIIEQLQGIQTGQNAGFAQQLQVATQGFAGLNQSFTSEINRLSQQLSACCCEMERGLDRVNAHIDTATCDIKQAITNSQFFNQSNFAELKFQAATDKAEILQAIKDGTATTIGYMQAQENNKLREELAAVKLQVSQSSQTAEIIAALSKK